MQYTFKILASLILAIAIVSCSEKNEIFDEPFSPQTYNIYCKVDKGPFISGSQITIQPMDEKLQVLGNMYNTAITDDIGNFVLESREFATPYAEFIANGYFFNEVKGELSNGTLTLRALVDLTNNTTTNVNILTHLKYSRIKNLVNSGIKFNEANTQAQEELFAAFGLNEYSDKEVSSLSIIAGTNESAALIAISSLLLMERSEAAFTEYLSKLSADFEKNGCFSQENKKQIEADKKKLAENLDDIKENIVERYKSLGITVDVKDLAYFIDWNNDGIAGNELLQKGEKVYVEKSVIEIPNEGGEFIIQMQAPISLYIEPQINSNSNPSNSIVIIDRYWKNLYASSDSLDSNINEESYIRGNTLKIKVSALQSLKDKSKSIYIYDYIGNVVATIEINQKCKKLNTAAPLLGEDGIGCITVFTNAIATGIKNYNLIEQYYNFNTTNNLVKEHVTSESDNIRYSMSYIYQANNNLNALKKFDKEWLNVYGDYCNVLSALYYSNLVYGWGAMPYITYFTGADIVDMYPKRESPEIIFNDLKNKLSNAIKNLPEKKNESLKSIDDFFFTSKDVARVLLANIHMYEGNYKEARPLLEKVIDNGFYSLDENADYNLSLYNAIASKEIIFALNDKPQTRDIIITQATVIPYITLSDVYLSLAECHYINGDTTTAEQYIQTVTKAKQLNTTECNVLMRIKEIREKILLHSGTYFAFLKRTDIAKDVCGIEDYQLLFPIPSRELQLNYNLTQNPGW